MSDKCPKCGRSLGIWTDDPILTPEGNAGEEFKGFTRCLAEHIIELQEDRKIQEEELLPENERTVFSPIKSDSGSGIFVVNAKHIIELRQSTEKLLNKINQTKEEYFNYDEEGNEIYFTEHQLDWIDAIDINNEIELQKFQVKANHIEDLRKFIKTSEILWKETWDTSYLAFYSDSLITPPGFSITSQAQKIIAIPIFQEDKKWRNSEANLTVNFYGSSEHNQEANFSFDLTDKLIITSSGLANVGSDTVPPENGYIDAPLSKVKYLLPYYFSFSPKLKKNNKQLFLNVNINSIITSSISNIRDVGDFIVHDVPPPSEINSSSLWSKNFYNKLILDFEDENIIITIDLDNTIFPINITSLYEEQFGTIPWQNYTSVCKIYIEHYSRISTWGKRKHLYTVLPNDYHYTLVVGDVVYSNSITIDNIKFYLQ